MRSKEKELLSPVLLYPLAYLFSVSSVASLFSRIRVFRLVAFRHDASVTAACSHEAIEAATSELVAIVLCSHEQTTI